MSRPEAFVSTRWSVVALAASSGTPGARDALEDLCRAYWWPLYAYLRRRGVDAEEAADRVQGLFQELLEKGRLAHADRARGRFRSWLLGALQFHLSHAREHDQAQKRGGRVAVLSLDAAAAEHRWAELAQRELDPEALFDRAWALALLDRALAAVERAYERSGKTAVFAALKPVLLGRSEPSLNSLAARLGRSHAATKTAAFRLRKALGDAIRAELAATVDDERELEDELLVLRSVLAAPPDS